MTFSNPIVGGTTLIRPAIHSPNFVTGVSGWSINKDGSAEFSDLTVRGDGNGDTVIIGPITGPQVVIGSSPSAGYIQFPTNRPIENDIATILAGVLNPGAANEAASLQIKGPSVDGATARSSIQVNSQNNDGSSETNIALVVDTSGMTLDKNILRLTDPRVQIIPSVSGSSALLIDALTGHTGYLLRLRLNGVDMFTVDPLGNTSISGIDQGRGPRSSVQITSNVTGIAAGTETVLMTVPSMTYVNGRAYRIHLNGLHQSTTASTYFLYRIRKGSATTTGTIYVEQSRVPTLPTASTNGVVNMSYVLVNNSGADITTALTWTGTPAAGTGVFATLTNNRAYATVEDIGVVGSWSGIDIT
jgi:hypothetical protein